MDNKKIMGNSVATTMPFPDVPKKISDLVDDTSPGIYSIGYAKQCDTADKAYTDGNSNIITDTYATKAELAEAIGEALEGDY